MSKTIVFDFDGVIHKYSKGWQDGSIYDEPNIEVIKTMKELMKQGYSVAIVSTRSAIQIFEWWHSKEIPIPALVLDDNVTFYNNTDFVGITNRKLAAVAYIDDRAICFNPDDNKDTLLDTIINFKPKS